MKISEGKVKTIQRKNHSHGRAPEFAPNGAPPHAGTNAPPADHKR